jgi:hypothetical protein
LTFKNAFSAGSWTVSVRNIETVHDEILEDLTRSFVYKTPSTLPAVSSGAQNLSSVQILKSHLSPVLVGPNWNALIAAIAEGDSYLNKLAIFLSKQIFKSTAEGKYLDRLAAGDGFERPPNVGLSDEAFRKLAIKIAAEKLTLLSFLQVLEIYYGSEALRANILSISEPYNLLNNDSLSLEIDGKNVVVFFKTNDFSQISAATALEVASVINRALKNAGLDAFAVKQKNNVTGIDAVRIYSGALGLRGRIKVTGGRAQNVLQFPTLIETTQATGTQWQIDNITTLGTLGADRVRFAWIGGTDPSLVSVKEGDYVNVYGSVFNASNRGSFLITTVTTTYFEIQNSISVPQTVVQTAASDVLFFVPTTKTINDNERVSFAAQAGDITDVFLAATTQAVKRAPFEAAYLHSADSLEFAPSIPNCTIKLDSAQLILTSPVPHGLQAGDYFYLVPGDYFYNNGLTSFPDGKHQVVSVLSATELEYAGMVDLDYISVVPQTLYKCFRDDDGLVQIKTTGNHGLSTGDSVLIENATAPIATTSPAHYEYVFPPSGAVLLDWSAATFLQNKDVLFCGGQITAGAAQNYTTVFSQATNTTSAKATMNVSRFKHSATLLPNGRVLVAGGGTAACEIYDPVLNIWINIASMNQSRTAHIAVLLNNGKVLVAGGGHNSAEVFDYLAGTWTVVATPSADRSHAQAVVLGDGRVFVSGGYTTFPTALNTTEIYNYHNDTWTSGPTMSSGRFYHQAINVPHLGPSGHVYITGGSTNGTSNSLNTVDVYNPATNLMSAGPAFTHARYNHGICLDHNGNIVILGGYQNATTAATTSATVFDTLTQTWTAFFSGYNFYTAQSGKLFLLNNRKIFATASDIGASHIVLFDNQVTDSSAGKLNGVFQVEVVNSTTFTYSTLNHIYRNPIADSFLSKDRQTIYPTAVPFAAPVDSEHIGPYIWDPNDGVGITGIKTTITQNIIKNNSYSSISVADASDFPQDGGYLVFNFGLENQIGPIKYNYKASSNLLLIDSSFQFPTDLSSGAQINLLIQKGPYVPVQAYLAGSFYVTDSVSGRISAEQIIDDISAAGASINKTILYPNDVGLGNQGSPESGQKITDNIWVFGSQDDVDKAREE